jgi:hypothetical protein
MCRIYMALMSPVPTRRSLVASAAACLIAGGVARAGGRLRREATMPSDPPKTTLATAPIELAGNWGRMIPHSADEVVELMRSACLDGVRLVSERQPARLRVDEHTSGQPYIWLHSAPAKTAWIVVDIGERAWSQLAYQFGHELGHVLANSWQANARPGPPCQWLEEAMVEAFSLRGLGRLAQAWKATPPFPGDNAYGDAIAGYRENVIDKYRRLAVEQGGIEDFGAWFARQKGPIEAEGGLNAYAQAAATVILAEYERTPRCIEALGALNRWPGRTSVSLADYLRDWDASCHELGASPALPSYLKKALRVS